MNGKSFLSTLAPDTQALAAGFADFLAERASERRTDSVAILEKPLSPMEQMFGTGVRYDSKLLHADALNFVSRALPNLRNDAAFTAMFARQLEYIYTWTADVEYPDLKARSLIPVDTEVPSGADFFTYRMYDVATKAAILHNYAKNSFPESDVYADEFKQSIKALGTKYSYSVQDMRAAAMSGVPLEAKKASAARYGVEKKLEQIACTGDTATGLYGITNAPGVAGVTKVSPAGTWAEQIYGALAAGTLTTTVQAILEDINAMANQVFTQTLGVHKPTTLVLPTGAFAALATTPRAPGFTSDTILQFILESSPWLEEITDWAYLNNAGTYSLPGTFQITQSSASVTASVNQTGYLVAGDQITFTLDTSKTVYTVSTVSTTTVTLSSAYAGTTHTSPASAATKSTGLAVLYEKNPRVLQLVIPQEFEQFPPEMDGLLWEIYCHLRTGGVNVLRPLADVTMSGISSVGAAY